MEEEKEYHGSNTKTTPIFCNIMSLDDQNVRFFPDGGDEKLEFENLGEVAQYRAVLPSNMHGLNVISHSFEKLIAYCNSN